MARNSWFLTDGVGNDCAHQVRCRVQSARFYTLIYILLIFVGGRLIWQALAGLA